MEAVLSGGCCQCPFPWNLYGSSIISWLSPPFPVCRQSGFQFCHLELDFLFLIGVPPVIIREAEHLILRPFLSFFSLKECEEYLPLQLASWKSVVFELSSAIPTPLTAPGALWVGGAGKYWWPSCSYRNCPQGSRISPCPTLVPPATRALGKVGFLGYEL